MEKLRAEWTEDRMVELGKARAQALGWPDAYAYSKALGEWALLEGRGALPVTVVRPSIIEAALSNLTRDGSAASGWRTRSSSVTPAAC